MSKDATLYALSTCAHCTKTRELLAAFLAPDALTVHYVDRMAGDERNDHMRELRRLNPELSFPTVVIGEEVVIGAKFDKIKELLDAKP